LPPDPSPISLSADQFLISSSSDIINERQRSSPSESKLVSLEHQQLLFSVDITPKQGISSNYIYYQHAGFERKNSASSKPSVPSYRYSNNSRENMGPLKLLSDSILYRKVVEKQDSLLLVTELAFLVYETINDLFFE